MKENQEEKDQVNDDKVHHDPTKIDITHNPKELAQGLYGFFKDTLSIKEGIDVGATIRGIKEDIEFKGFNVWVLICSIVVASIGLNLNSPAVIIGAMLISPLMGPIRGIGLAVGTNDFKTLVRSLINFGVMIGISLLTSVAYFLISPLDGETPELIARVKPLILDVFIAFFGGLAGIIAATRGAKSTVVPGVAIATALMPPLCTAGYGIANGNFSFFIGAFYLFLLNSLFIFLSTVLVIRYLKFPLVEFVSKKIERKVKTYIIVFMLLIVIPSGFVFVDVIKESIFEQRAEEYVHKVISYEGTIIKHEILYDKENPVIQLNINGQYVPKEVIDSWEDKLDKFYIGNADLEVIQKELITTNEDDITKADLLEYSKGKDEIIFSKNKEINELKEKLQQIESTSFKVDMKQLSKKVRLLYEGVDSFRIGETYQSLANNDIDTLTTVIVTWEEGIPDSIKLENTRKVTEWLKLELEDKTNHQIKVQYE